MSVIQGRTLTDRKARPLAVDDQGRLLTSAGSTTNTGGDVAVDSGALVTQTFSDFPSNISAIGLLKTLVLLMSGRYEVLRESGQPTLNSSTPASTPVSVLAATTDPVVGVVGH